MNPGIGTMIPFPSIWGHWAGGPGDNVEDVKWLDDKLKVFFETEKIDDVDALRSGIEGTSIAE
jgi:hypothetical protein